MTHRELAAQIFRTSGRSRFGSIRFGSGLFENASVRFGSVRFGSVRFGSVRFGSVREIIFPVRRGSACVFRTRRGSVRFGSFPRPVPADSGRFQNFKIHQRGGAVETGCSDLYDVIGCFTT